MFAERMKVGPEVQYLHPEMTTSEKFLEARKSGVNNTSRAADIHAARKSAILYGQESVGPFQIFADLKEHPSHASVDSSARASDSRRRSVFVSSLNFFEQRNQSTNKQKEQDHLHFTVLLYIGLFLKFETCTQRIVFQP